MYIASQVKARTLMEVACAAMASARCHWSLTGLGLLHIAAGKGQSRSSREVWFYKRDDELESFNHRVTSLSTYRARRWVPSAICG